jgi:outer membrane protein assembly factor BamB
MTPAIGEQSLAYLSLANSRIIGVSLATGEMKWERTLSGTLSAPAVARDRVLVGSTDNMFYALDADSGDIEWQWRTGGDVIGSTADSDGVYFAALDNIIRRVKRTNGNQQWKKPIATRPVSPPRVVSGTIVVAGLAPAISEYDAKTGTPTSTYSAPGDPPGRLEGPPLIDSVLRPFRVSAVVLLRDGRAVGLRPVSMMFREQPLEGLPALPGRGLTRERLP